MHWWCHHWQNFMINLYELKRFHVAVVLFSNRSQKMSSCGKNVSDTQLYHILVSCLIYHRTDTWQYGVYMYFLSKGAGHNCYPNIE